MSNKEFLLIVKEELKYREEKDRRYDLKRKLKSNYYLNKGDDLNAVERSMGFNEEGV